MLKYSLNKKLISILSFFIILLVCSSTYALPSQDDMIDQIIESIETEPNNWFSTGNMMIYSSNLKNVGSLKEVLYPNYDHRTEVAISYSASTVDEPNEGYVQVNIPFESGFIRGKQEKRLLKAIKKFLAREFIKEIGNIDVPKQEKIPEIIPEPKHKTESFKPL